MIADVAVESFLTDIFSTTDLTIDLRSLDTELEISSDAEELKEILFALSTLSIYPSIKLFVSINSDKLVTPESKFCWIVVYKLSKKVFVLFDDVFVSLTKACKAYANTKI